MNFNRVLKLQDLKAMGITRRKPWEIHMARESFKMVKAKSPIVLGVGSGLETTPFYLAERAGMVFPTDLYLGMGDWKFHGDGQFLKTPYMYAPTDAVQKNNIFPMHMDMRELRFADNSVDFIYSSGSIEHLDSWQDIARCARELGRVLKKGGILSLSTEWSLDKAGGFDNVYLFDLEALNKYIIEPSGLVMVDELDTSVDYDPLWSASLHKIIAGEVPEYELALNAYGWTFTSIHICFKKP